jgi:hypothetical protein
VQKNFEEFLGSMRPAGAPALSPTMRKALFEQFVQWTRKSIATPNQGGSSP